MKSKTSTDRETKRLYKLRNRQKFPDKHNARNRLYKAFRRCEIVKSTFCQLCLIGGVMDGHHEDYAKPLDVVWLCRTCHLKLEWLKPAMKYRPVNHDWLSAQEGE